MMYDVAVIGGGPAGASLAYFLGLKGYRVAVYDMAPRPALRPCGWLVPVQVRELVDIPGDFVINEVRGYRVYLDGSLIGEGHGRLLGYLVDKPRLIKYFLEQADYHPRTYATPSSVKARERVVIATGVYWWGHGGDKILAVQAVYRLNGLEEDVAEIRFESNLVGYYWVFPLDRSRAKIGVGGYASYRELVERLQALTRSLGAERLTPIEGSPIYVGGVDADALRAETPRIGEAAGFVYPISGEGIRPSIASAKAISEAIAGGKDPVKLVKDVVRWIRMQRLLLNAVRRSSPEKRAEILRRIPVEDSIGIALGTLPAHRLVRLAVSYGLSVLHEMARIG